MKKLGKKQVLIGVAILLVLLLAAAGGWYWWNEKNKDKDEPVDETTVSVEKRYEDALNKDKSPEAQADYRLILANQAMSKKEYDKAIGLYEAVLVLEGTPADRLQSTRQAAMYAYALKGNFDRALVLAKEYEANISGAVPSEEIASKEKELIASVIKQLEAKKVPSFGDQGVGE